MKFTKARPYQVGTQFVAVYVYQGRVWANTYKINTEGLYRYSRETDGYEATTASSDGWHANPTTKYVIL